MLDYLTTMDAPSWLILFFVALAVVAEILRLLSIIWGTLAPKLFKISTSVSRRKNIENIILENQVQIQKLKEEQERDRDASKQADSELREGLVKTDEKLDDINQSVLDMRLSSMRNQILDFSSGCRVRNYTREQYLEILDVSEKYHRLITKHNIPNGKFIISLEIIKDRFKELSAKENGFLEQQLDFNSKDDNN